MYIYIHSKTDQKFFRIRYFLLLHNKMIKSHFCTSLPSDTCKIRLKALQDV